MTQGESMPMWLGTMSLARRRPTAPARSRRLFVGEPAAEVFGDVVFLKRVGGGDGIVVAAQALDGPRGDASLPQADQPEAGDAAVGEQVQLFVGDLVEAMDVAAVFLGELLQPDVGALGHQDDVGHPGLVGAEGFVLVKGAW